MKYKRNTKATAEKTKGWYSCLVQLKTTTDGRCVVQSEGSPAKTKVHVARKRRSMGQGEALGRHNGPQVEKEDARKCKEPRCYRQWKNKTQPESRRKEKAPEGSRSSTKKQKAIAIMSDEK